MTTTSLESDAMERRRCKNCVHGLLFHELVQCRRYPPVPCWVAEREWQEDFWPEMPPDEWCGEFKAKVS